jgi:proteasome-associated ATPase
MKAARDIFARYLTEEIPYAAGDGGGAAGAEAEARRRVIAAAVSAIYAPNGEGELATVTLRDGRRLPVRAADLVSGASIAKIAAQATEAAFVREVEGGEPGVRAEDALSAVAGEFESLAAALTPANCRQHLGDLPQDVDVVRVEHVRRKVTRPHLYLNAA